MKAYVGDEKGTLFARYPRYEAEITVFMSNVFYTLLLSCYRTFSL